MFDCTIDKAKSLIAKANCIAQDYRGVTSYSMGEYIKIWVDNKIIGEYNNCYEYSKSSRYKATHGSIDIKLTKKEFLAIEKIEGLWTIRGKNGIAKWLRSEGKKGWCRVSLKEGFIYNDTHSTVSFLDAKHTAKKREIVEKRKAKDMQPYLKRFIGVPHLKAVGACNAGIENAAQKIFVDTSKIGGLTIEEVLNRAKGEELYTRYINNIIKNNFKIS